MLGSGSTAPVDLTERVSDLEIEIRFRTNPAAARLQREPVTGGIRRGEPGRRRCASLRGHCRSARWLRISACARRVQVPSAPPTLSRHCRRFDARSRRRNEPLPPRIRRGRPRSSARHLGGPARPVVTGLVLRRGIVAIGARRIGSGAPRGRVRAAGMLRRAAGGGFAQRACAGRAKRIRRAGLAARRADPPLRSR